MKYKNLFGLALSVFALGATVASCTDANDWETDPTYNRMFGVNANKISLERNQDTPSTVSVTFNPIKGAEYYIVEVSTDSLYDDVPMGSGEHAIVFGQNKEFTKSPIELTGLAEETSYYMRMKTMSSTTPESHWVYYNSGASFKTLGIIYDVPAADILEDKITLHWIAGSEVTHIAYATTVDEQRDSVYRELTPDEIAASSCTVTGLNSNKTYNFYIYNNGQLRGTKTVKTAKPMPAADLKIELPENTTVINQETLDNLAQQALALTGTGTATLTIGVPAGKKIEVSDVDNEGKPTGVTIPDNVSVTFFGMAGEKPVLTFKGELSIAGNHDYVRFENVDLDGENTTQYLINEGGECNINDLSFNGVDIMNFTRSIVRFKDDAKTLKVMSFDNCVITNQGSSEDYAFIYISGASYNIETINVSNCTFNTARYLFRLDNTSSLKEINITGCTFYNVINASRYFITAQKTPVLVSLDKVLLGKSYASGKGIRLDDDSQLSVTNTYRTNDFVLGGNDIDDAIDLGMSSDEVFADPANGDFSINNVELMNNQVGDPRWIPAN